MPTGDEVLANDSVPIDEAPRKLIVDGQELDPDDLTFGEQRELRRLVRELAEDPNIMPAEAALMDFLPALVTVFKRRDDQNFGLEQALQLRFDQVVQPDERPTPASDPDGNET